MSRLQATLPASCRYREGHRPCIARLVRDGRQGLAMAAGARVAWRNAPKCANRKFAMELRLLDKRDVVDAQVHPSKDRA